MAAPVNSPCTFQKHPNGIHEIHIRESSRKGVEEFFRYLSLSYDEAIADSLLPVRMLIITPSSALPVIPLTAELKRWTAIYGQVASRQAILYEGLFGTMIDVLVRNFGSRVAQMRIFRPTQQAQALDWLAGA